MKANIKPKGVKGGLPAAKPWKGDPRRYNELRKKKTLTDAERAEMMLTEPLHIPEGKAGRSWDLSPDGTWMRAAIARELIRRTGITQMLAAKVAGEGNTIPFTDTREAEILEALRKLHLGKGPNITIDDAAIAPYLEKLGR